VSATAAPDPGAGAGRAGRVLAWAARPWHAPILLALFCLALYLPGIAALPPFDRDEARFVQATRQMLETGDFVQIRFQDEPRHKKPVGIHWLQAAAVAALSDADSTRLWPYRLVSVAGATLGVLFTFLLGATLFDRRTAVLGAAGLAATLLVVAEGHLAKTDAVLFATAAAAAACLARLHAGARAGSGHAGARAGTGGTGRGAALGFWVALGAAGLLKGPVVPAVALLAILALGVTERGRARAWIGRLGLWWGPALAAAIVLPWLVLVSAATDGVFLGEAVRGDLLPKLLGGQESHGAPPGYYLALLPIASWPMFLAVPAGLLLAWRDRRMPAVRVLLAWLVPAWLMFELVPTKLPHYVLPLYPALALLAARAILADNAADDIWHRRLWRAGLGAALVVGIGLGAGLLALGPAVDGRWDPIAAAPLLAALAGAVALAASVHRRVAAAAAAGLTALAVFAAAFALVLPRSDGLWLSRGVARALAGGTDPARVQDTPPVAAAGYAEPSLVFLLGTATMLAPPAAVAGRLAAAPGWVGVVATGEAAAFAAAAAAAGLRVEEVARVAGVNYSRGRRVTLVLVRAPPGPGR